MWDGSQLLYEIRGHGGDNISLETMPSNSDAFGVVGYVHGIGIDAPLSVRKGDELIIPHTNWRGEYAVGTTPDGSDDAGCGPVTTECLAEWPAPYQRSMWKAQSPVAPERWHGSLILGQRDASGLMYMRNRYYDPQTGRFTQEDPIGLVGGLNLYGFASGDPVNYSDPFGLCPDANNPACEMQGEVFTLSFSASAGIGIIAANWQIGIAINSHGDAMGYFQGGPSAGAGVTAGGQIGGQSGSLNDLLKPTGEGGGGNITIAPGVVRPSVSVSASGGHITGGSVGAKGGIGAFLNLSSGGVGTSTVNIPQAIERAVESVKEAAKQVLSQAVSSIKCTETGGQLCTP